MAALSHLPRGLWAWGLMQGGWRGWSCPGTAAVTGRTDSLPRLMKGLRREEEELFVKCTSLLSQSQPSKRGC